MLTKRVGKRDVEGFLSAFNFNAYGCTNVNDISDLIYTKDDQIPQRLAERKRGNAPPAEVNHNIDTSTVNDDAIHNPRIKKLMNEIEDKVFNGKVKIYQVFKQFDKDNDGYVSYDDFEKCLTSIKVFATPEEMGALLTHVDKNKNGFLDFSEFSQVFTPSMSEKLVTVP